MINCHYERVAFYVSESSVCLKEIAPSGKKRLFLAHIEQSRSSVQSMLLDDIDLYAALGFAQASNFGDFLGRSLREKGK